MVRKTQNKSMLNNSKSTVFKNKYFVVFFLTLIVLERLAIFHKVPKAWGLVSSIDYMFFIPILAIAVLFYFATKRNVLWNIFSQPKNVDNLFGDLFIGLGVGVGLAALTLGGLFSSVGLPEFNAFNSIGVTKLDTVTQAIAPLSSHATFFSILFIFVFFIFHVAFNEELWAATVQRVIDPLSKGFTNPILILKGLFVRSVLFALLHIFVWNLMQPGYFISAFIVSFAIFGVVFLWRGLFAAVMAHGTYDGIVDVISKTGLQSLVLTSFEFIIILTLFYIAMKKFIIPNLEKRYNIHI